MCAKMRIPCSYALRRLAWAGFALLFVFSLLRGEAVLALEAKLFGVHDVSIENKLAYRNPFDLREIELRGVFEAPSGRTIGVTGFFDGDGRGGHNGRIWKLRISPDETGEWTFRYSWRGSGQRPEGSAGSFEVVDSGLKGPITIDEEDPRFFRHENGERITFSGYYLSELFNSDDRGLWESRGLDRFFGAESPFNLAVTTFWQGEVLWENRWSAWGNGYTYNGFYPVKRGGFFSGTDYEVYDLKSWHHADAVLEELTRRGIVWLSFDGIYPNVGGNLHNEARHIQENFIRYYLARFGAYPYVMLNIAFEYEEFLSDQEADSIGRFVDEHNVFGRPITIHGLGIPREFPWVDFISVQLAAGTEPDPRRAFDITLAVLNERAKPVVCLECAWEGEEDGKLSGSQVALSSWGQILAGGHIVYAEQFAQFGDRLYGDGAAFGPLSILGNYIAGLARDYSPTKALDVVPGLFGLTDRGDSRIAFVEPSSTVEFVGVREQTTFMIEWLDPISGATQQSDHVATAGSTRVSPPDPSRSWIARIEIGR